jgi:hypothetical protein
MEEVTVCLAEVDYMPITSKALQNKIQQVEDFARQLWLPGAHSCGPVEDREHLPPWVKVFH